MFSLFDGNASYQFDLLAQKKVYEDVCDYVGITMIGTSIRVYVIDCETNETVAITNMKDIALNVPDYFVEYCRGAHTVLLTEVTFLEKCEDWCCFETKNCGIGRAYRISSNIAN